MDFESRINDIRREIANVRDAQYAEHSFEPVRKLYQSRKGKDNDKNFNLKDMYSYLNLEGPKEMRKKRINITKDDIFADSTQEKILWANLDIPERVEQMENYLSQKEYEPPLTEEIKDEIIDLVQNGKLHRKSDIRYDEYSGEILSILALSYDEHSQFYYINLEEKKSKRKTKEKLKKLFK